MPGASSRRRHWRVVITTLAAVALAQLAPAAPVANGALGVWIITPPILTLTQGVETEVALTASVVTGMKVGTVEVQLPGGIAALDADAPSPWIVDPIVAGPPGRVVFHVTRDPDRLESGDSATFHITVLASSGAGLTWTVTPYEKWDTSSKVAGPTMPIESIVLPPLPTPTPRPTPTPTPKPTPEPTPTPRPTSTPSPSPSPRSTPTPRPTSTPSPTPVAAATARPVATSSPDPLASPSASPSPIESSTAEPGTASSPSASPVAQGQGGPAASTPPSGAAVSGSPPPARSSDEGWVRIPLGEPGQLDSPALVSALLGSLGMFDWLVPSALMTVPGLLLVLTVLLQLAGAFAWLPVVRRRIGEFGLFGARRKRRGRAG